MSEIVPIGLKLSKIGSLDLFEIVEIGFKHVQNCSSLSEIV